MYLRDFVVSSYSDYPKKKEFGLSAGCVESLYFSTLPKKTQTGEFSKIIIEAIELNQGKVTHQRMLDVIEVRCEFDFEAYWNADVQDRKLRILKLIQIGVIYLANTFSWDFSPFDEAYHQVIAKNFIHQFFLHKPKPIISPNKKFKAQIYINFESDAAHIYLVITNKAGEEVINKFFVSVPSRDFFIVDAIGELVWDTDERVVVTSKNGKQRWEIELRDLLN